MNTIKTIAFLGLIIGCVVAAEGQPEVKPPNVQDGPVYTPERRGFFWEFITADSTDTYIMRGTRRKRSIEVADSHLRIVSTVPVNIRINQKPVIIDAALAFNGNICFAVPYLNKTALLHDLYLQPFNLKTKKTEGPLKKIATMPYEKKHGDKGSYTVQTSEPNDSLLLVWSQLPSYRKDTVTTYKYQVLNQKLEKLWGAEIDLPYTDKQFSVKKIQLSSTGSLIISGIWYFDHDELKRRRKANLTESDPMLLLYSRNSNNPIIVNLALNDSLFLIDWDYKTDADNHITVAGFYSKNGPEGSYMGTFYETIDPSTGAFLAKTYNSFSYALRSSDHDTVIKLYEFSFKHLLVKDDGGAILTAEYSHVHTTKSYGSSSLLGALLDVLFSNTYYRYNDIVIINYNHNGNLDYQVRVPKEQYTQNDGARYSSFNAVYCDSTVHLFYNDINIMRGRNAYVTLTDLHLDHNGKWEKEELIRQGMRTVKMYPYYSKTLTVANHKALFLNSEHKHESKYTRLMF